MYDSTIPWSGICTAQHYPETKFSSVQPAYPTACSKRCGSSSPLEPEQVFKCNLHISPFNNKTIKPGVNLSRFTCRQTRDFSRRYCSMRAPSMDPPLLKWISMYFPNRLELSLRMVFALPKARHTRFFFPIFTHHHKKTHNDTEYYFLFY